MYLGESNMFLNSIIRRNPQLVKSVVELHQLGKLPSNSYVLDIDTIYHNAKLLYDEAQKYDLKVFAMTKQIGRNPIALKAIKKAGIEACVTVDMNDARPVYDTGLKVGHLGHLVQVPHHETNAGLSFEPMYWTVFSYEKAMAISKAHQGSKPQKILARIYDEEDTYYKGHEGGFMAKDIVAVREKINQMPGLEFAGITSFPTQLFDEASKKVLSTPNLSTLIEAGKKLKEAGMENIEINAPGTTSSNLFKGLKENGVTQVEPGNSITGTVPSNAFEDLKEIPAMVYVSEVSHQYKDKAYCYGGGMYIDPVFSDYDVQALVGTNKDNIFNKVKCDIPDPSAIDYYGILDSPMHKKVKQGDTVIFAFRAQTFVTRAYMVAVSGIQSGNPIIEGIHSVDGRPVGWPMW